MPLIGYKYTWFKSIGIVSSKEARLDRALVASSWQTLFPNASLQTSVAPVSDHTPILLQLDPVPWCQPHHFFRFSNAWLLEPELDQLVKNNWSYYPPSDIITKLSLCADDIAAWSKNITPNFRKKINKQREDIEGIRTSADDVNIPELINMQNNLATLLLQEESYWKQRSKVFLLSNGDANNKFFHESASARKRRNTIKKL